MKKAVLTEYDIKHLGLRDDDRPRDDYFDLHPDITFVPTTSDWNKEKGRYYTAQEIAAKTEAHLITAGSVAYTRLNNVHDQIRFPRIVHPVVFQEQPSFGFCHVTAACSVFAKFDKVNWLFCIANFYSKIGLQQRFFDDAKRADSRMFFAIAVDPTSNVSRLILNRSVFKNGVIFQTADPNLAMRNVLLMGARTDELRAAVLKMEKSI